MGGDRSPTGSGMPKRFDLRLKLGGKLPMLTHPFHRVEVRSDDLVGINAEVAERSFAERLATFKVHLVYPRAFALGGRFQFGFGFQQIGLQPSLAHARWNGRRLPHTFPKLGGFQTDQPQPFHPLRLGKRPARQIAHVFTVGRCATNTPVPNCLGHRQRFAIIGRRQSSSARYDQRQSKDGEAPHTSQTSETADVCNGVET